MFVKPLFSENLLNNKLVLRNGKEIKSKSTNDGAIV